MNGTPTTDKTGERSEPANFYKKNKETKPKISQNCNIFVDTPKNGAPLEVAPGAAAPFAPPKVRHCFRAQTSLPATNLFDPKSRSVFTLINS